MFNSNILDVAIGMIFIYLLLSLMCSAASEIIELMLKKRAIDLERGIRELLDPGTASGTPGIVQKLYDHALVNNLFGGTYEESRIGSPLRRVIRTQLPSYIPARNFALALMDLVALPPKETRAAKPAGAPPASPKEGAGADTPPDSLPTEPTSGASGATVPTRVPVSAAQFVLNVPPAGVATAPPPAVPAVEAPPPPASGAADNPLTPLREAITNNPLLPEVSRRSLITLVDAAGNDVAKARENIENWFNSSMDRVSSWYKRRAQLTILVIGFFVAITVNVDTITVAKRLSTDKALRESLVAAADAYAKANAPETTQPAAQPTASPTPIPACVTDSNSPECKNAQELQKPCENPDSAECQRAKELQEACKDPASEQCKNAKAQAKKLREACKDPNSARCRDEAALQQACKDPSSPECQRVKELQQVCKDPSPEACKNKACEVETSAECLLAKACNKETGDSDKCQEAKLAQDCEDPDSAYCRIAKACNREPNSIECQRTKELEAACLDVNSPKCKYLSNEQQIRELGLPIGWDDKSDPKRNFIGWTWAGDRGGWWDQLQWHWLGWLLTALAISLGAPFWFDLLNKFIVIRSAVKPHEKSPEEKSKG